MDALNEETLKHYFDVGRYFKEYNSPSQLYNVDKSGILLDPQDTKKL